MDTVLISLIIPVYNAEKYLQECLDSIIGQHYGQCEILLVDDGSTDRSGEICDSYGSRYSNVRVFHKANGGVSAARNLGLDNASGEWIWFIDADDKLAEGAIGTVAEHLADGFDCVMTGYRHFIYGKLVCDGKKCRGRKISKKRALEAMYRPVLYPYEGYLPVKLFRKSVIDRHGLRLDEEVKFNEDREFCLAFFLKMDREVWYEPKPLYLYYANPEGAMASSELRYNPDYITDLYSLIKMKDMLDAAGYRSLLPLARAGILTSVVYNISMILNFKVHDIPRLLWVLGVGWENYRPADWFLIGRMRKIHFKFFRRARKVHRYIRRCGRKEEQQ